MKFFSGSPAEAVEAGLRGGLVVVPSAPVLVGIEKDPALRAGVLGADLAITDSGLMVLMWWLLKREKLERVSGLEYLKLLLEELRKPETGNLKPEISGIDRTTNSQVLGLKSQVSHAATGGVFWVMPTAAARDQNLGWLRSQGFNTTTDDCYVAPHYGAGELHDDTLLALVRQKKPAHIIIALGGGVQERLGWFLRLKLEEKLGAGSSERGALPGIHCIGAAIGFLSGEQVNIPPWADYFYLGWLFRSLSEPGKFIPRYWRAKRLVWLMWRWRDKAPASRELGAGS